MHASFGWEKCSAMCVLHGSLHDYKNTHAFDSFSLVSSFPTAFTLMSLIGKVAVITGGGGVIGAAVSRTLVNKGAKVVIGDIQEKRAKEVAEELNENAKYVNYNYYNNHDIFSLSKLLPDPALPRIFKLM